MGWDGSGEHELSTFFAPFAKWRRMIGSASTMVAVTIMHKNGLAMSFGRFVKLTIPFAALQIALATVYVLLVLR